MSDEKRACVAAIAATLNGNFVQSLYDYGVGRYRTMNITKTGNFIQLYDFSRNSFMSGTLPNLYDYKTASFVQLNLNGNQINGFDYKTSNFFNGSIYGRMVSIYDFQTSRYYSYVF